MRAKRFQINGNDTHYIVYDNGEVYNEKLKRFLKTRVNNTGYIIVHIRITKLNVNMYIQLHRLVADLFVPNPDNKPQVNHINGDKLDNRAENLEWVTAQENTRHAYKHGLARVRHGERVGGSKYTEEQIIELCELMNTGKYTNKQLCELTGISRATVGHVRDGETWTHVSYQYPNIHKKTYRFKFIHSQVNLLIIKGKSTGYITDWLMKNFELSLQEARNLVQNRRKALKKKNLIP